MVEILEILGCGLPLGEIMMLLMTALLCHKDPAQGPQKHVTRGWDEMPPSIGADIRKIMISVHGSSYLVSISDLKFSALNLRSGLLGWLLVVIGNVGHDGEDEEDDVEDGSVLPGLAGVQLDAEDERAEDGGEEPDGDQQEWNVESGLVKCQEGSFLVNTAVVETRNKNIDI